MEASPPILSFSGPIAEIRFNRPRHKNLLQSGDLSVLRAILAELAANEAARVVVITGSGDIFSAGFDLNALAGGETGDAEYGPGEIGLVADELERLRLPTIARLNGGAYGGATDLALACDFRIGVKGMKARVPAARLGIHFYASGCRRFVSRVGIDHVKRMFLTGETLGAEELLRIGFLTELVDPAALDAHVRELAETLAENAPLAVQGMKLSLDELARGAWDDGVFTARANGILGSEDLREGLAAQQERRAPRFTGR